MANCGCKIITQIDVCGRIQDEKGLGRMGRGISNYNSL